MFSDTFDGCTNLPDSCVYSNMFGLFTTAADYMFTNTFWGCSSITTIPNNLFGSIVDTPKTGMF